MAKGKKMANEAKNAVIYATIGQVFEKIIKNSSDKLVEGIKVKPFGFSPNDEALLNDVKSLLSREKKIKFTKFVKEMKERDYSFWWFRNVIATMQENFQKTQAQKTENRKDSPAFIILDEILDEDSWDNQAEIAGYSLLRKTLGKRIGGDLWEIIENKGQKLILFSKNKFDQIDWQAVSATIGNGKNDFVQGFKNPVRGQKTTGIKITLIIGGIFVVAIIVAAITL